MSDAEAQGLDDLPSYSRSYLSIGSHDVNDRSSNSWFYYRSSLVSSVCDGSSSDKISLAEYRSNNNDKSRPTVYHIIPDTGAEPNTSRILTTADIWRVKAHRQNRFIDHNIDWRYPVQCSYCCLGKCDHKWTGLGNENYNTEELQRRRWLCIPDWVFHLTLNILFYLLSAVISILHKYIENIWTTCRTRRRIHPSPWTIVRSVGIQILPLSAKGIKKRQQHLLMILSTTSTVLLFLSQVECGTCVCSLGLFQSDLGGHLLMDVGMSTWTQNFTKRRQYAMSK